MRMKPRTQIDEAFRSLNESRENVWCQGIDRKNMCEPIFRFQSLWLLITDSGIVNHSIHRPEFVDLRGDGFRLLDAGEIANNDGVSTSKS